jgi:predicted DNA-binding transcriptional regulator YafY
VQGLLRKYPGKNFRFGYPDSRGVMTVYEVAPACLLGFGTRAVLVALCAPSWTSAGFFFLDRIQAMRPLEGSLPDVRRRMLHVMPLGPVSVQSFSPGMGGEDGE